MKAVVSSTGNTIDAPVSPVFGRCAYFVFVDTDTMEATAEPNAASGAPGGAGIQAAQSVVRGGAEVVLSGNLGPNAMQVLSSAGIPVYPVRGGTVREAVEALKTGTLSTAAAPTVASDYGRGGGGFRSGRGGGRGRMGGGRGG
jgi:predicted Fe-Mo cluster-binding NifX family protein